MSLLFERYDAAGLEALFEKAGVLAALRKKGFEDVAVDVASSAVEHVLLSGRKEGSRHVLLDACLRRIRTLPAGLEAGDGVPIAPLDLLVVHWVREEDPTASFSAERPALPLQEHPGLGILRRAFRVALAVGSDLGADAIANLPKFYHDALIFQRSRLFLFVDPAEQGRFEALSRDLDLLPLVRASIAVAGWCVHDHADRVLRWDPGYLVFPLSARLTEHFHSPRYTAGVDAARDAFRFHVDDDALAAVFAQITAHPA